MKLKIAFIAFIVLFLSMHISAQDLIYKKNSDNPVKANVIIKSGPSRSYRLFGSSDSAVYYVSASRLDSIIYANGTKESFNEEAKSVAPVVLPNEVGIYNHHLAGFDVGGLLYNNICFSYEYLTWEARLGFKGSIGFKTVPDTIQLWGSEDEEYAYAYRSYKGYTRWHATLGADYYFFRPGTFRLITGMHYVFGSYNVRIYLEDENHQVIETRDETRSLNGLFLNVYLFYNLNKHFAFNLGIDQPIIMNPSMQRRVLTAEFLYSF